MQHYRQRRQMTIQEVAIRRDEDAWPATIIDVTTGGMRLRSQAPLMIEDMITVKGESWSAEASVVWMKDGSIGVKLANPMSETLVARLTGKAKRLNRKSRVGFGLHFP